MEVEKKKHSNLDDMEPERKKKRTNPSPPLTIKPDPDREFFTTLLFEEPVDIQRLNNLLVCDGKVIKKPEGEQAQHFKIFNVASPREHLKRIAGNYEHSSESVKVRYQFSNGGISEFGRVYPIKGASAGELQWELRCYCLEGLWTALDIKNAHPTILCQVLHQNGLSFPKLKEYCDNRDEKMLEVKNHYQVDRYVAKNLFIRLLYLGKFENWAKDNKIANTKKTQFIKGFSDEMNTIASLIVDKNPVLRAGLKPNKKSIEKSKKGPGRPSKSNVEVATEEIIQASNEQVISYFLQELERRVLRHMFDFLVSEKLIDASAPRCMLRYDGIDLPLDMLKDKDLSIILNGMSDYVLNETGFKLGMDEKPYEKSSLTGEIETQLDYETLLQEHERHELDNKALIKLPHYAAMKWYFEKFITFIQHDSVYAWVKKSEVLQVERAVKTLKKDLITAWEHVNVNEPKDDDIEDAKPKRTERFIHKWLLDPEKSVHNEVNFVPYNVDLANGLGPESKVYNLFRGFANPPNVKLENPYSYYTEAFHYIGLQLCENDPFQYQFFWNCLVRLIKEPRCRPGIAFVFQGKSQGSGADVFLDAFGSLLGSPYYKNSSRMSDFTGPHAGGVENKKLVVFNEAVYADSKEHQSTLKSLITAEKTIINPKGLAEYSVDLYHLITIVSNGTNAVCIDNKDNERRFVIFKPHNGTLQLEGQKNWGFSSEDWSYLAGFLFKSKEFRAALYEDVMDTDISSFDSGKLRNCVLGEEYYRASEMNSSCIAKFFATLLRNGQHCEAPFTTDWPDGLVQKSIRSATIPVIERWGIESAHDMRKFKISKADFGRLYKDFLEAEKGIHFHGEENRFSTMVKNYFEPIIRFYKNNIEMCEFVPYSLWKHLVTKKWVKEGAYYDAGNEVQQSRQKLSVDLRFEALAALMDHTPQGERDGVNPGRVRPLAIN